MSKIETRDYSRNLRILLSKCKNAKGEKKGPARCRESSSLYRGSLHAALLYLTRRSYIKPKLDLSCPETSAPSSVGLAHVCDRRRQAGRFLGGVISLAAAAATRERGSERRGRGGPKPRAAREE